MPRGKSLTELEKGKIIAYKEEGCSGREIARKLGRSHRLIQNFLRDPESYGTHKRRGGPSILNSRDKRKIINKASNSTRSLRDLQGVVDKNVSRTTVWRTLKCSNIIKNEMMRCVPALKAEHKLARMDYGRRNMNTNWSNVS